MVNNNPTPFDPDRYVGTITVVTPNSVKANFPRAISTPDNRSAIKGNVGDFVFIECDEYAVFGRVIEITLPDREQLSMSHTVILTLQNLQNKYHMNVQTTLLTQKRLLIIGGRRIKLMLAIAHHLF